MENKKAKWFYFWKIISLFGTICQFILFIWLIIIGVNLLNGNLTDEVMTISKLEGLVLILLIFQLYQWRKK